MDGYLVLLKFAGEGIEDLPKELLEDLTTNMKVSTSGTTATASGTIRGEPIVTMAKKAAEKKQ
jgi:hypothetical protein